MFRLILNDTNHGTFDTVGDALSYIYDEIENGELETIDAKSLTISIIK